MSAIGSASSLDRAFCSSWPGVNPVPGVAEVIDDRPLGSDRGHVDHLLGIEPRPVLHGVHQHLAKRRHQAVAVVLGQVASVLVHEVDEPLGRDELAADRQRDPVRQTGFQADAVTPVDGVDGALRHVRDGRDVERRDEAREDVGADRRDELARRGRRREHDGLEPRARRAEFLHEREVVVHRRVRVRDDHVDGT